MKHHTQIMRYTFYATLFGCALALAGALNVVPAQDRSDENSTRSQSRGGARDPFQRYRPPVVRKVVKVTPPAPKPVDPPTIQERIERYKAQKMAAMNAQLPAPKPTTALLLSEMQVVGIFRTPRGYAAMIEATPIKLSYVIHPGESFYDGQLVAIEENRLVFRRETRWTDGRLVKAVETKPLRQPDAVANSMTATRTSSANTSNADPGSVEKKAAPVKQ